MNLIYYPKQDFYNLMQNPAFREEKMNRFLMNIERFANGEIAFEEGAILLDGKISFFFAYVKYEGEEKSQIGKYGYLIQGTRFNDDTVQFYVGVNLMLEQNLCSIYYEPVNEEARKMYNQYIDRDLFTSYLYKAIIPLEEIQRKALQYTKKIVKVKENLDREFNENPKGHYESRPVNLQNGIRYQYVREYNTVRPYTKHVDSFAVRGHYRHYKSGKTIFIKPFQKGSGKSKDTKYIVGGE